MKNKISNQKSQIKNPKAFSLVELLIVIVIIGVLSVVSFVAIEGVRKRAMNDRMTNDLVAIANSLEDYKRDHQMSYPVPDPGNNQNVLCYYADATYAHGCAVTDGAIFRQGMVDNVLLSKRYLREVPTDPRTGSRYVYGVTNDGKYFQVAGIYERDDGTYEARTVENLAKGFQLPSIIRAYDGADFVTDKNTKLPYSPDYTELTGTLENITGTVTVNGATPVADGFVVHKNDKVKTDAGGGADIYFSDGSITVINPNTELVLNNMEVKKNDKDGTITKILLKLNAGKIWSKVVRLASNSEFKVETTGSIAGVRGTECGFEVDAAGKLKEVQCLSGSVEVTDIAGTTTIASLVVPSADPVAHTPAVPQQLVFTDTGFVPSPMPAEQITAVNNAYYKDIPLNSSMVPYIISANGTAAGGTITVRNVNYFANIVNADLGLTDPATMRRVQANKLALYATTSGASAPIKSIDISGTSDPYTINDVPFGTYILRFEYWENGHPVDFSSYSMPPVDIKSSTNITEESLYPNLFTGEKPTLTLEGPQYVPFSTGVSGNSFTVNATINNPSQNTTYTVSAVTADGSTGICTPPANSVTGNPAVITVTANDIGSCALNITATPSISTEQVIIKTISVQIISATAKLILNYPNPDPANIPSFQAGQPITFQWTSPSAPTGPFKFIIDKLDPAGSVLTEPSLQAASYTALASLFTPGQYKWTVSLIDSVSSAVIDTQYANFTIGQTVNVDFTFSSPINCPPASPTQCSVNTASQVSASVNSAVTPTGAYTYEWEFSGLSSPTTAPKTSSFTATLNAPDSGASYQASITLNVRDSADKFVGTKKKFITVTNNPAINITQVTPVPSTTSDNTPDYIFNSNAAGTISYSGLCSSTITAAQTGNNTITFNTLADGTYSNCIITVTNTASNTSASLTVPTFTVSTTPAAVCGDGKNEGGETCDDGNKDSTDGCDSSCKTEQGYTCTVGTSSAHPSVCTPICGDSLLVTGEECDPTATTKFHTESDTCAKVDSTKPYGSLTCSSECKIQTSGCMNLQTYCPTKVVNSKNGVYDSATLGCWFVATLNTQNCNNVCPTGLTCFDDPVNGTNWDISSVCSSLGYTYTTSKLGSDYSPVIYGSTCKNDNDNIHSCSLDPKTSTGNPSTPYRRICKCQ